MSKSIIRTVQQALVKKGLLPEASAAQEKGVWGTRTAAAYAQAIRSYLGPKMPNRIVDLTAIRQPTMLSNEIKEALGLHDQQEQAAEPPALKPQGEQPDGSTAAVEAEAVVDTAVEAEAVVDTAEDEKPEPEKPTRKRSRKSS